MKEVRPTTGKTLAALFSILGSHGSLQGKSFLDLFSGTGRVAQTARERGATIVTVELLRDRASAIRKSLGERDHVNLCMDVRRALIWLEKHGYTFDVIFADPPYEMQWMAELPKILALHTSLLKRGGVVVIERSHAENIQLEDSGWDIIDERHYGISVLDFLKPKENCDVQA